jgi:hypothetical protein
MQQASFIAGSDHSEFAGHSDNLMHDFSAELH